MGKRQKLNQKFLKVGCLVYVGCFPFLSAVIARDDPCILFFDSYALLLQILFFSAVFLLGKLTVETRPNLAFFLKLLGGIGAAVAAVLLAFVIRFRGLSAF